MKIRISTLGLLGAVAALAACSSPPPATPSPMPAPRLPAGILAPVPPTAVGMDAALPARLDAILAAGIADHATPGAAVAVGRHGRLVLLKGYGRLDWAAHSSPVTDSTLFDLASLTKVVGTTTAAMILEEEGRLDLARPVREYLPDFNAPEKAPITVRMLLEHRSGLKTDAPLWRQFHNREEYLQQLNRRPLWFTPGDSTIYSDWNMILMQFVIERVSGKPLDAFLEERVFRALGMHDTGYNPLGAPPPTAAGGSAAGGGKEAGGAPPLLVRIAPTEVDTISRRIHVHGTVHDENAYALGGVSGHAGLFSSARDLAVFAQMLLNGGEYNGVQILKPATIARWTARQGSKSSRALGWDTPTPGSSAGHYFGPRSFGHTGFTGTSIWIDPERSLFVVLLTNRVNPTRHNQKHEPLRRAVADAAQSAIHDAPLVDWEPKHGSVPW